MSVSYSNGVLGPAPQSVQNFYNARLAINTTWTIAPANSTGTWYYLPASTFALTTDCSPNINTVLASSVTDATKLTWLTSGANAGSFVLPTAGVWYFSALTANTNVSTGAEFRWMCVSSPAWTGSNGVSYPAKSYTGGNGATGLAQSFSNMLMSESLISSSELASRATATLPAGSVVTPLLYANGGNSNANTIGNMYVTATLLQSVF